MPVPILSNRWLWKTAWRDTRKQRVKLVIFCSTIILGIATIVCINSLNSLLSLAIHSEAKSLLGADLLIRERDGFSKSLERFADSLTVHANVKTTQQIRFNSMGYFNRQNSTAFVQVCASTSDFPLYGDVESEPNTIYSLLNSKTDSTTAIIDETLFIQKLLSIGDTVSLGSGKFVIRGYIKRISGDNALNTLTAPRIFIPLHSTGRTKLLDYGSLVSYCTYFKFDDETKAVQVTRILKSTFTSSNFRFTSPRERSENVNAPLNNITTFLNLIGFVALMLGIIGMATSITIYLKSKQATIAALLCLGVTHNQILLIFLIQCVAMSFIGTSIGIAFGLVEYFGISFYFADLLNGFTPSFYFSPVLEGFFLGVFFPILFCIPSLQAMKHVSPMQSLHLNQNSISRKKSFLYYLIVLGITLLFTFLYVYFRIFADTPAPWKKSLIFITGFCVTLITFYLISKGLIFSSRLFAIKRTSYSFRQGLLNLNRPNNQTVPILISMGLGVFLLSTILFVQKNISYEFNSIKSGNSVNLFLIDVQPDQTDSLNSLFSALRLPVVQAIPVVTMQIQSINQVSTDSLIRKDSSLNEFLKFEFRATYRETLFETETIQSGSFPSSIYDLEQLRTGISVSKFFSERAKTKLGDSIIFNVQGVLVKTIVQSIREIDFKRIQANFSLIFPPKILENAPTFFIYTTKAETASHSAKSQQAIVTTFPNITIFDLRYFTEIFETIINTGLNVTQALSLICILTGLLILVSSLLNTQYVRIKEQTLLKVLGASSRTLASISFFEFFFIGIIAGSIGTLLAIGAAFFISSGSLFVEFRLTWQDILLTTCLITIASGIVISTFSLFLIRQSFKQTPLEILRQES